MQDEDTAMPDAGDIRGYATADYEYELPGELIAQDPLPDRASSRLMVLDRESGGISHHRFSEIATFLRAGDLLVLNDTRVLPVRLHGVKKDTSAKVELLLLKRKPDAAGHPYDAENGAEGGFLWECLVKPGRKLRRGAEMSFYGQDGEAPLLRATIEEELADGNRLVRFSVDDRHGRREASLSGTEGGKPVTFEEILDRLGEMPLPPYITHRLEDRNRYNTVYAVHNGSAAAPTAGLHFTPELLEEVQTKGVGIAYVTLHVGLGTFRPVRTDDVRKHHMHSEWYAVPEETARRIHETKKQGGRVICVGTTSCRTIESASGCAREKKAAHGQPGERYVQAGTGETEIFIYPGFQFRATDGLLTNFHLPQSTLLMLVSAFAGRERVLSAYREAVRERYRFFSFGDAMLIL